MFGGIKKPRLRKRVVTIFVIAVLFPCLFLGYIGLKSIKQEKQWQQQLVRENLERSLSLTIDKIESAFDDQILASLHQLSPPLQLTTTYINSIRKMKTQSSLVQDIFLLNKELEIVFPKTFRNVDRNELGIVRKLGLHENEHLDAGELLEVAGKLDEALNQYQKGFSAKLSQSVHAALLFRIARCQFNKGDYANAVKYYQKIINEDNNRFYGEEMPYVLIAHLHLIEIAETKNQSLNVNTQILEFYRMLVEHSDKLEHAQYSFCLYQIYSRIQNQRQTLSQSQCAVLDSLEKFKQGIDAENDFHTFLQKYILPEIEHEFNSKLNGNQLFNNSNGRKDILYKSGVSDSVDWTVAIIANDNSKSPIRFIGIRIKINALFNAFFI